MVRSSEVLHPRLLTSQLIINPTDAEKAGLTSESQLKISFGKRIFESVVDLDQSVPEGVVLVPRSMGILLIGPENAVIKAVK